MEKIVRFILPVIIVFAIIIAGVSIYSRRATPEEPNGQAYFNAAVLSVSGDQVTVICSDTLESGFSKGEEITFSKSIVSAAGVPELSIGDEIRIVYNENDVDEGSPIELNTVFSVYKLEAE